MARTKQWSRHSYPKKAIRRYSSEDEEEEDDYDDNNDFNNNIMEIENDLQNEALEESKEDNQANPPASGDYLGPPRKPLNAFYFFKVDEFDATRAANPTLTMMEVIDVIGQKWGDLDESKKAEYQERFEKHNNLYEESLKPRVWKPPVLPKKEPLASTITTGVNPNVPQMGSSDVKPEPPKRPLTGFFLYKADIFNQTKEENPDAKVTELTKIISQKWMNVDHETKAAYEAKFIEAKQKYEQEIKEYEEKYGLTKKKRPAKAKQSSDVSEEEHSEEEEKERAKPVKSSIQKTDIPAPPKRPLSAFFLFKDDIFNQVKEENPDVKVIGLTKIIAQKWMNVDHETKAAYEAKVIEARQKYEQEIKEYEEKYGSTKKKRQAKAKAKQSSDESEEEHSEEEHSEDEHSEEEEKERAKPAKSRIEKVDIPAPPKRPLTGFFLYKADIFNQTKEENPEAKITEITKIIAQKWMNVDHETKAAYEAKHTEALQRYGQEIKEYEEKYGLPQKKKRATAKQVSDESEGENSEEEEEKERAKPGKTSLKKSKKV